MAWPRSPTGEAGQISDALAGRPVRLRFAMRDMKLYAFQFAAAAV